MVSVQVVKDRAGRAGYRADVTVSGFYHRYNAVLKRITGNKSQARMTPAELKPSRAAAVVDDAERAGLGEAQPDRTVASLSDGVAVAGACRSLPAAAPAVLERGRRDNTDWRPAQDDAGRQGVRGVGPGSDGNRPGRVLDVSCGIRPCRSATATSPVVSLGLPSIALLTSCSTAGDRSCSPMARGTPRRGRACRQWRKLHLAVDATGEIVVYL